MTRVPEKSGAQRSLILSRVFSGQYERRFIRNLFFPLPIGLRNIGISLERKAADTIPAGVHTNKRSRIASAILKFARSLG